MSDDVIDISTGQPRIEVVSSCTRPPWPRCECERLTVDVHARTIHCTDCGAAIDPVDWIAERGKIESSLMRSLQGLRVAHKEETRLLNALREEEKLVKARIAAAKRQFVKGAGI